MGFSRMRKRLREGEGTCVMLGIGPINPGKDVDELLIT